MGLESVLIVSPSDKAAAFFTEILTQNNYQDITCLQSGGFARRTMLERDFDLCIVNAPLADEFGDKLARDIASRGGAQVILVVKAEVYDEVSSTVEDDGVFTVSKPLSRAFFWNALKLAGAAWRRMNRLQHENSSLVRKIEDIRLVDRAKCLLMEYLGMSEAEAHRHIEKQAMNLRRPKREVAQDILKTYDR